MRRWVLLLAIVMACGGGVGCHFAWHRQSPPGPVVITRSEGPLSIVVNPYTGWGAAPAALGMPVYANTDEVITEFPSSLAHTLVIQRNGGNNPDLGYLNGQVKVPTDATLYVAILARADGQTLVSPTAFGSFRGEGWTEIFEPFAISQTDEANRNAAQSSGLEWRLWYHPVPPGPVTITSDAVPAGGIFFIGRAR